MSLSSGKPAPYSVLLPSDERVFETVGDNGAGATESLGGLDRFRSDLSVCNVFREVDAWEAFARYFPGAVNFEQKFGVWVSGVNHKLRLTKG